jgi:hypothetical protein
MKMLMVVYSGPEPQRISSVLDRQRAGGYSQFAGIHGVGTSGRREGTRAWPGDSTMFVSVVPADATAALLDALRELAGQLPPGERLHAAVLPTETFF